MNKVKVLFLAANPVATTRSWLDEEHRDMVASPVAMSRLRLDEEFREIAAKIRTSEYRDSLELIPRLAVRPDDLQQALLEVRPTSSTSAATGVPPLRSSWKTRTASPGPSARRPWPSSSAPCGTTSASSCSTPARRGPRPRPSPGPSTASSG
jgi:hypothetical protein